ncbi:MAG: DNA-binding protein [Rikenellaceae bacterium]
MWAKQINNTLNEVIAQQRVVPNRLVIDGEVMLDNYEVCNLLRASQRTLERYRREGLKCHIVGKKAWYKESEIILFMKENFEKNKNISVVRTKKREPKITTL